MKKLYKNGKECMAEDFQVDQMVKAGWSLTKEIPKPSEPEGTNDSEPEAQKPAQKLAEEVQGKDSVPRKIPRRKPIAKKTDSEE